MLTIRTEESLLLLRNGVEDDDDMTRISLTARDCACTAFIWLAMSGLSRMTAVMLGGCKGRLGVRSASCE